MGYFRVQINLEGGALIFMLGSISYWVSLQSIHLKANTVIIRERPFNLKGGGGYGFFLKWYSDSQCCWKKYSDFGGGKKLIWFTVFVI